MESSSNAIHCLIAGGVGGAIATAVSGYPLDTIKVRLQTQPLAKESNTKLYNGIFDCIRKAIRQEGYIGFYRGMSLNLMTNIPVMSSYFFGYNVGLKMIAVETESHGPRLIDVIKAGIFAGFIAGLFAAPGDRIKCLLQVGISDSTRRPLKMIQFVYQKRGIMGFYRGTSGALLREVFACTGYFVGLEISRDAILSLDDRSRPETGRAKLSTWQSVLAGIGSGCFSCFLGLPGDVVKTRQMSSPVENPPQSILSVFRELWNQEGLKGLYRGGTLAFLRLIPTSGICFFVYDNMMQFFDGELFSEHL